MAALLLLVSLIAPSIAQYSNYYSPCLTPLPPHQCDNNQQFFQTRYIYVAPNNGRNSLLDNVCHTFFEIKDNRCSYVSYVSAVYKDGSAKSCSYITTTNTTDSTRIFSSPSCSFVEYTIGRVGQYDIMSRRITLGPCGKMFYPVLVSSLCQEPPSSSDMAGIRAVLIRNGITCPDLLVLPSQQPFQCVNYQPSNNTGSTATCQGSCYGPDYYDNVGANFPSYRQDYQNSCGC